MANNDHENIIIDNTGEEQEPVIQKNMQRNLPDGWEIDEKQGQVPQGGINFDRIPQEDLVKPQFAEGINKKEMFDSLVGDLQESSEKMQDKQAEENFESAKKTYASKAMFKNKLNEILEFDVEYPEGPVTFRIRRLNEGEFSDLANRKLWNKELADMSEREYQDAISYRRKFLAKTIVEPQMSVGEWHEYVDVASLNAIYDKAQEIVLNVNPGEDIDNFF